MEMIIGRDEVEPESFGRSCFGDRICARPGCGWDVETESEGSHDDSG